MYIRIFKIKLKETVLTLATREEAVNTPSRIGNNQLPRCTMLYFPGGVGFCGGQSSDFRGVGT